MRPGLTVIFCLFFLISFSQDSAIIKVHFLYGSKPLQQYKPAEKKWFGGVLGGHVGIEADSNRILNFLPSGKFHWLEHNSNKHSKYVLHYPDEFNAILGAHPDSVKTAVVYIPVSIQQKIKLDSIAKEYVSKTPYDYAFIGMRCGAATYEILAQLGILPVYTHWQTFIKIFYPKKLRSRLLEQAIRHDWIILKQKGSERRKWEKDWH